MMLDIITGKIEDFIFWLSSWGGVPFPDGKFCLLDYKLLIAIYISQLGLIVLGYAIIAFLWYKYEKRSPNNEAAMGLRKLRFIFIFCAICGYGFNVLHLYFPVWKLQIYVTLPLLIYFTWSFVFQYSSSIKRVYELLSEHESTKRELIELRERFDNYGRG